MPIVDDGNIPIPSPTTPNTFSKSAAALTKALKVRPELREQLISEDYANIIDYTKQTRDGIKFWQTEKIRLLYGSREKRKGFPMRRHHTVNFFDLLMVSIPFYTKMAIWDTIQLWDGNADILQLINAAPLNLVWQNTLRQMPEYYQWNFRNVVIYDVPNEYWKFLMAGIPFQIDETIVESAMLTTRRAYPLFEGTITRRWLCDEFIWANWDKIVNDI